MDKSNLITGATGLVGGNLTAQILQGSSTSQLLLLVRGETLADARRRVFLTLKIFLPDLDQRTFGDRIIVLCGDVTKEDLGLAPGQCSDVLQSVTHLIHAAANVQPGSYQYRFDASRLPSRMYVYQLRAGDFVQSRKMMLTK
jgi:long-chain acyl-CoA synthetase